MARARTIQPTPPRGPDAPEVFRGLVVDAEEIAGTVNRWCADGFSDFDWQWLDPDPVTNAVRVFVWAWRHELDEADDEDAAVRTPADVPT